MTKTMMILLFVCFFVLLFYGFRKIDRKLEALVRLNNRKQKNEENGKKV